mgnify:CR=1 FL=1
MDENCEDGKGNKDDDFKCGFIGVNLNTIIL